MLKQRNSSLQRRVVYCICKAWCVCTGESERIKKLISESEEKKLFAGLGSVRIVKNCGLENAARGHRPPIRQITYLSQLSKIIFKLFSIGDKYFPSDKVGLLNKPSLSS